jgi:hypothetical protein
MKKVIRLTESELTDLVKRIISESPLGPGMLKNLYNRVKDKYSNVEYDEGDDNFDPYIYIPLNKTRRTGLLIDLDGKDNFEIHYDNGRDDRPWKGWEKEIERLNSVKYAMEAIDMFMEKHKK